MKIIIVDDDEDDRDIFRSALCDVDSGYECVCLETCEQLLLHLLNTEQLPDLVFIDLIMPKSNGIDCVRDVRQHPRYRNLKIIGYTTMISPARQKQWEALGVKVLLKPDSYSVLVSVLGDLMKI